MTPPLLTPRPAGVFALALAAALLALLAASPVFAQAAIPSPTATAASPAPGAGDAAVVLAEAQRFADAGDVDAALIQFNAAVALYQQAGNVDGEVGARFYLALYLRKLGRCAEALPEYQAALDAARLLNNQVVEGSLWLGIGDCRGLVGQREDALSAYDEAARRFLAGKDDVSQRSAVSALNSAGGTLVALGRSDEAIAKYQAGLSIATALKDQRAEMMLQAGLGNAYHALNRHAEALATFDRCRELAEAVGDRQWQQLARLGAGGAHAALYQSQEAYADYAAGVALAQARGDSAGEAMLRMDAGLALHDLGRYGEALSELEAALALERQAGNRLREGLALTQIGATLEALGRSTEALARYEAAQAIATEVRDPELTARVANDLGLLYDVLGRAADAQATLEEALRVAKELNDPHLIATAHNNLGTVANHRGQYAAAERYYNDAIGVFKEVGPHADYAAALNNLAQNYDSQGRYDAARPIYELAQDLHRAAGDVGGEAIVTENLAGDDVAQGRYGQALTRYQAALAVFQERGMLQQQAVGLSNLATLYLTLGRPEDAHKSYDEALALRQQIGDRAGEGIVLGNLAALEYEASRYDAALAGYREAAAIAAEAGDPSAAATWQNHVAAVLSALGRDQEAHQAYQAALEQFRTLGDQPGEAAALNGLGATQLRLRAPEDGLAFLDQAFALYADLGEVSGQATSLSNKAALLEKLGRSEEALETYRRSLALREQLRGQAPGEALRVGLTQGAGAVYDAAATLAMKLGRGEEGFAFTERARSRQLLDQLNAGRLGQAAGVDSALLEREQALRAEISRLDQGVREERIKPSAQRSAERVQALNQELGTRQAEYDALLIDIKSRNPQYAAMVSAQPATLAQIQALLPPDVTLVDYYIGVESAFAFVIRASSFQTVTLDAPAAEVWEQVAALRKGYSDLQDPGSGAWLSERLIAPVAPFLTTPVVGIIPHGPLHYLPFAALPWAGSDAPGAATYLSDHFVLFSLPSVSALPYLPLEAPALLGKDALVMSYAAPTGLPPLEAADAEAQAVAAALGAEPLLGEAATESALRRLAPGRGVIHVAAHGQLNSSAPLFSRLLLAPDATNDGSLEVHEVYGLDLKNAGLVTLSACQTDMGKLNTGDDVTGLSRSFLYAGARSVVASLWSVDDAATAALMQAFYKNLAAGMGKAQALAAAQASVRGDVSHPEWRNPYYWAAFVLSGDPGVTVSQQPAGALAGFQTPWAVAGVVAGLVLLSAVLFLLLRVRRRVL